MPLCVTKADGRFLE